MVFQAFAEWVDGIIEPGLRASGLNPGTEPGDKFANVPRNQAFVWWPANQQTGSNSAGAGGPA
jgi:hypothetical protein